MKYRVREATAGSGEKNRLTCAVAGRVPPFSLSRCCGEAHWTPAVIRTGNLVITNERRNYRRRCVRGVPEKSPVGGSFPVLLVVSSRCAS